jgi:hypothetical protein
MRETCARLEQDLIAPPAKHLYEICNFIIGDGNIFDERCQISIRSLDSKFLDLVTSTHRSSDLERIDMLNAFIYQFSVEYDLSSAEGRPMELQSFMSFMERREGELPKSISDRMTYARQSLPIRIIKTTLNNDEFSNLKNIKVYSEFIKKQFELWDGNIASRQRDADRLGELFEKHANDFNFSGLHTGFSDMAARITKELRFSQIGLGIFGALLFAPSATELFYLLPILQAGDDLPTPVLIASGVGTITLTLLVLYFFRIALRKADSCRAQLMQIHLRMSLCRFIQPYTDYSRDVREKHAETFAKFESLIFSGIVGTTEKIPSTFDGLEQITSLAKSLRGGKD